jgi:hypothetical protein
MEYATISAFEDHHIADGLRWSFTFASSWLGLAEVNSEWCTSFAGAFTTFVT